MNAGAEQVYLEVPKSRSCCIYVLLALLKHIQRLRSVAHHKKRSSPRL